MIRSFVFKFVFTYLVSLLRHDRFLIQTNFSEGIFSRLKACSLLLLKSEGKMKGTETISQLNCLHLFFLLRVCVYDITLFLKSAKWQPK